MSSLTNRVFTNADQEVVPYDGSPISWRVSAYVIVEEDGEILLIKNKTEKLYDIVGGGIEMGETIEEAISRECIEEAGIRVEQGKLVASHVDWFYHEKGVFYQTLQIFYSAELLGELQEPTEQNIEWRGFVPIEEVGVKYKVPPIVERVIKELGQ